jgi:putative ABC transport system permease protein
MGVIMGIISSLPGALSQGVLWGIMALGVYITYKILDIADLTVDGSFALGGSVCAICIVGGMHPMLAILVAIVAGCVAGAVTGILHAVFDIPAILAGILTQLGLYSINLRIMGRSNTPLLKEETIVDKLAGLLPNMKNSYTTLIIGVLAVVIVILVSYWFFGTEVGSEIRATGNNEAMVKALGGNTRLMKALGLAISNGLVALSGALVCQSQGYADVNSGQGAIVTGLAAIVIGNVLLGWGKSFGMKMISVITGSVIYRIVVAIVMQAGWVDTSDTKLFSAILVAIALAVPVLIERHRNRPQVEE